MKLRLVIILCALSQTGCFTSKWAIEDPSYAQRYDHPYSSNKLSKWSQMGQQLVDARHVEGYWGVGLQGMLQTDPTVGGAGLFLEGYPTSFWSVNAGLESIFGNIGESSAFGGISLGTRVQTPTRIAPFVGFGTYLGLHQDDCEDDWDCDCECEETTEGFAAVYPEVGAHFWLTRQLRLTGNGRYMITTDGRDHDFWLIGVGLAIFSGSNESSN